VEGHMSRKPRLSFLLAAIFCILSIFPAHASETLTILHVNDVHGRIFPYVEKEIDPAKPVSGAGYLAAMISRERARNPEGSMLLSAGDMFQGTPVSNLFRGRPVIDIMNRIGFDVMALGNHEFDWGLETLGRIVRGASFPVICANIADAHGLAPPGVKPYVFVTRKGVKVAIVGLLTPDTAHITNPLNLDGYTISDPEKVLPKLLDEVRGKGARVVVLLTHLGVDADKSLAASIDGIDVIVGGHSHTALIDPVRVGRTIIVQAGHNGLYLGVLDLVLDEKTGQVTGATEKNELRTVWAGPGYPTDKAVEHIADQYGDRIKDKLRVVVGRTRADLARRGEEESSLGDAVTDAMRESTGADIAIFNAGGLRDDIWTGPITMEQVYTALPFDDVIVTMELKGSDLLDLFEQSADAGPRGMLQVSGVRIGYDPSRPRQQRVKSVIVGGEPLRREKSYRVSTNDFLAQGGDRFTTFSRGTRVTYGKDARDVFVAYLKRHSPLGAPAGLRIVRQMP